MLIETIISTKDYDYYYYTGPLAKQLECSPKDRETSVQSQVESY